MSSTIVVLHNSYTREEQLYNHFSLAGPISVLRTAVAAGTYAPVGATIIQFASPESAKVALLMGVTIDGDAIEIVSKTRPYAPGDEVVESGDIRAWLGVLCPRRSAL
jgi:hypothetical protein